MSRVAILIDGGYFMRRLPKVQPKIDAADPAVACMAVKRLITSHLSRANKVARAAHPRSLLYRAFYYDAPPFMKKTHLPISGKPFDFSKSPQANFHLTLHENLRRTSNLAVRLGELRDQKGGMWELHPRVLKELLGKKRNFDTLTDDDFRPTFRQKAVDMRIGLDIATITLKKQAETIVLVAGDSDFVPAAKLARREGLKVVLDPLWQDPSEALFEHIDGVYSGFPNPKRATKKADEAVQ